MESENLHHHHHQQVLQLVGSPSSSSSSSSLLATSTSSTPSYCYGAAAAAAAGTNHIAWSTPNLILNPNVNGATFNSREAARQGNDTFAPPYHSSMIQNLGFPWSTTSTTNAAGGSKIKEELSISSSSSDHHFPKFTEMLSSPSSSIEDFHLPLASSKSDENSLNNNVDLSEKLLLKTITASSFHFNGHNNNHDQFSCYSNANNFGVPSSRSAGSFSQIYPSINISNLSQSNSSSSFSSSSPLDINLQALDLLTSARFSGSFGHHQQQPSCDNLEMFKDHSFGSGFDHHHHMQQQSVHHQRSSCSPNKVEISAFPKGATQLKRPSSSLAEPATSSHNTPKKSRLESRTSCPPFKVRKEKLGDRIAALQQLVAPFGKTDTASVLMEAIGYIKFLQNQVETLSVPYMKSSRNKPCRTMQGGLSEDGNEETKPDLRSRGLCLVPLSCMTYVTNVDGGGCGGVWPPSNFGGGT